MSQATDPGFLAIALDPSVAKRAGKIALIVGTVIALINHGDRIVSFDVDLKAMFKIAVTYFVPYFVSTWSSVQAVRGQLQKLENPPQDP